jgi:hypothetical protein
VKVIVLHYIQGLQSKCLTASLDFIVIHVFIHNEFKVEIIINN